MNKKNQVNVNKQNNSLNLLIGILTLIATIIGIVTTNINNQRVEELNKPIFSTDSYEFYRVAKDGKIYLDVNEILQLPTSYNYKISCQTEEMKKYLMNKNKGMKVPYFIDFDLTNIGNSIANDIKFYIMYPSLEDDFDSCDINKNISSNNHFQGINDVDDYSTLNIGSGGTKRIRLELWSAIRELPNEISDEAIIVILYNNNVGQYLSLLRLNIDENSEEIDNPSFSIRFVNFKDSDFNITFTKLIKKHSSLLKKILKLVDVHYGNKSRLASELRKYK